jgi:RNA polymerase sigma-70 factor (ECF subfamily)
VVALNRAVALTERDGPEAGLAALETIHGLEPSYLWHAALADNLRRLDRTSDAAVRLRTAVALAPTEAEQRLLRARLSAMIVDPD